MRLKQFSSSKMIWLIPFISTAFIFNSVISENDSRLLLVQMLFRHGDCAPRHLYPKDPNSKDNWPEGLGKLTLIGKKQQYAFGKFLRSRYRNFITTNPNEVLVNSSAVDRCLSSAAVNLAAFYAPEGRWKVEEGLNWQPIPIHFLPLYQDKHLSFLGTCPRVDAEMATQRNSKDMRELYHKFQATLDNVSNHSGLNISEGINAFNLYDTLRVEKLYNLTIPEWVDFYWRDVQEVSDALFRSFTNSPLVLRLRVGPLLDDIIRNMKTKINGNTPDLKVRMYSAHDINIAAALKALNFTQIPRPPYCASLMFELHEMPDASMAVRLLYLNSTDPLADAWKPSVLELASCSEFCPVEKFTEKVQHLIPDNWEEECQLGTGFKLKSFSFLSLLIICTYTEYIFNILSNIKYP